MKIAICDDDQFHRDSIKELIEDYQADNYNFEITEFECGEDIIESYNKGTSFDVIFLDIEMADLNGIQAAHSIREIDAEVIICFVTSFEQYVFNSFKVGAFDYILKPVTKDSLNNVLARIIQKYKTNHSVISINWKDTISKVEVKDILYIEGYQRLLTYFTLDRTYKTIGKLKDVDTALSKYGFLRCHQGFLVNMNHIKSIEDKSITLTKDIQVEMSFRKKQECIKAFNKFIARNSI